MLKEWLHVIDEFRERSILLQGFLDMPLYQKTYFKDLHGGGLYFVCSYGLLSILQILGDDNRIPWKAVSSKYQPLGLWEATRHRKLAAAKWLLERQLFHPDEARGHIPALYIAVLDQNEEIVDLLLGYGADPLLINEKKISGPPWAKVFAIPLDWPRRECSKHNYTIFKRMFHSIELLHKENPDRHSSLNFDWKCEGLFEALRAKWDEASKIVFQCGANDRLQTSPRADYFVDEDEPLCSTLQITVNYSGSAVINALLDVL